MTPINAGLLAASFLVVAAIFQIAVAIGMTTDSTTDLFTFVGNCSALVAAFLIVWVISHWRRSPGS